MYVEKYFSEVQKVMDEVLKTQKDKMEQAAAKLVETCEKGGRSSSLAAPMPASLPRKPFTAPAA